MAPGVTQGRNVRSSSRCSMCPAIHTNSRSWLRSSSTHEPSDPPLRVVFYHNMVFFTLHHRTGVEPEIGLSPRREKTFPVMHVVLQCKKKQTTTRVALGRARESFFKPNPASLKTRGLTPSHLAMRRPGTHHASSQGSHKQRHDRGRAHNEMHAAARA